jgi:ubiquinone/menaquinone biosynthesis C-methylase UbiE
MPRDADEKALLERFSNKYDFIQSDLLKKIERSNCGCDYGASSFATLEQVDNLGNLLELGVGTRLLEVGAGSGWPGLYLAKTTACDVTLIDLPIEGLLIARARAVTEGLSDSSRMAVASGSSLPFKDNWFDAISHSDVLCCLLDKLSVLRACRAAVREGGKMIFSVILTSPDLSKSEYEEAVENGPSFISADDSYPNLLHQAGWELVEQVSLMQEFLDTLRVMLENELSHTDELENLLGKEETSLRLSRSYSYINAVERGLIRRDLFHAVPTPGRIDR